MTLYEIERAIEDCMSERVDEETGEIITEIDAESLNALEMEKNRKIENILCWIKNLTAESEAVNKESKALDRRAKALSNRADSLKNYISEYLNGEKWSGVRAAVSFRRTKAVQIDDLSIIPKEYIRSKVIEEPDKTSIKDAILKFGETIPGAHIKENVSTIVR